MIERVLPGKGIRLGVVGTGAIGARYLAWGERLGAEVAGVEPDSAKRAALEQDGRYQMFSSSDELQRWRPTHVIVSTPPDTHKHASLPFIAAGLDVLVEKPVAGSLEDGEVILEAAEQGFGKTYVTCNMRFHAAVRCVRENLTRIGRPIYFHARFGHRLSQMRTAGGEFARTRAAGGGVVLDCIHEFDYLAWMFGPVTGVHSQTHCFGLDTQDAEDLAQIWVLHDGGTSGTLLLDFLRRQKIRSLEVTGLDASLVWLSEGKKPEVCRVTLCDQHGCETLLADDDLDGEREYLGMLQSFFADGSDMQTVAQAQRTLATALRAQEGA